MHSPTDRLGLPVAIRHAEGSDTMRAWERFLTGGPMLTNIMICGRK